MRSLSIQEIVRVIGKEAAAELIKQIGGVTYYFPEDGQQSRHVSISEELWRDMCRHFSGWVYVPKGSTFKIESRNQDIREKRKAGAHIIDLAIEYDLSDRQIRTICAGTWKPRPKSRGKQALGYGKDAPGNQRSEVLHGENIKNVT
jgi:Mor family transcriptional regulator